MTADCHQGGPGLAGRLVWDRGDRTVSVMVGHTERCGFARLRQASIDRFGLTDLQPSGRIAELSEVRASIAPAAALDGGDLTAAQSGLSGENCGLRFSRWDARPSLTSGLENPRNSSASDVSKIGPAARSQLFSASLVQRMA